MFTGVHGPKVKKVKVQRLEQRHINKFPPSPGAWRYSGCSGIDACCRGCGSKWTHGIRWNVALEKTNNNFQTWHSKSFSPAFIQVLADGNICDTTPSWDRFTSESGFFISPVYHRTNATQRMKIGPHQQTSVVCGFSLLGSAFFGRINGWWSLSRERIICKEVCLFYWTLWLRGPLWAVK